MSIQTSAAELSARVEDLSVRLPGTLGVAAHRLATGESLSLHAEDLFPAASVIKLAILVDLFLQAAEGALDLSDRLPLGEADRVEGSGILKELRPGLEFTLEELAALMIIISDNTASNMLIDRLGTDAINRRLQSFGLRRSRLERKFFDYAARDRGLDNWACPGELASLLVAMEERRLGPPSACEGMIAILLRQQLDGKIPRLLPPETKVAHKTGTVTGASHDAGIIYAPTGPLVLAVLTKGMSAPEAESAIRQVALWVYEAWGREA